MNNKIHVLVPAAGSGLRFGAGKPKQYLGFQDGLLIDHTISQLLKLISPQNLIVGLALEDSFWSETLSSKLDPVKTAIGGDTRAQTVSHLLAALGEVDGQDWVLIHDVVRPCIDEDSFASLFNAMTNTQASGLSLGRPVHEAVKRVSEDGRVLKSENRGGLWATQTPQVFRYTALLESMQKCMQQELHFDDEMMALHHYGFGTEMVEGSPLNIKITTSDELELAERYWKIMNTNEIGAQE